MCIALVLSLSAIVSGAHAQAYPLKPVRVIVSSTAGGPLDFVARTVSEKLAASLHQPFVMENRAGASHNIAADAVAKSAPDGYTLLFTLATTLTVNPALYRKLPFDAEKDFRPISTVTINDQMLVVHSSIAAKNIEELILLAKTQSLAYASGGNGSAGHLVMELLLQHAGFRMTHIPYKANGPAVADLIGGQVQAAFLATAGVLPYVKSGKLRAFAVSGANRSPTAPDVPTIREAGYPQSTAEFATIVLAPAATPDTVVVLLQDHIAKAIRDHPDLREKLRKQGFEPVGGTSEEAASRIKADTEKWTAVVRRLKLQLD